MVDNKRGQRLCERQTGQRYGRWKVSANTTNLGSRRLGGVALRDELENAGLALLRRPRRAAGQRPRRQRVLPLHDPGRRGRLGFERERPRYKRPPKGMPAATWRPLRAAACDELIRRIASLFDADPPLDMLPHPETFRLLLEPSPLDQRAYKRREDLLDAVISAWTAAFWSRHGHARCQVVGVPPDGAPADVPLATIIAPGASRRREDR